MKKVLFVASLALLSIIRTASAQIPTAPVIIPVATAPTGACTAGLPNQQVTSTGVQYSCQGGTWAAIGGGGGGTPGTPASSVQYNNAGVFAGTTTIYLTPSGGDDSTQIQNACDTGGKVELAATPVTHFQISAGVTMSTPCWIEGAGPYQSIIELTSATTQAFNVNYQQSSTPPYLVNGAGIRNLDIIEASGVTPTAGGAIKVGAASGAGFYTMGLHVENIGMHGLWGGIDVETGQDGNWFKDLYCDNFKAGGLGCIYYNSAVPSGDDHFLNIESNSYAVAGSTGVTITQSDTIEFTNLKLNTAGIVFTGAGQTVRVRFINPSIEGNSSTPACGVDFGTGANYPTQISFVGGGIGLLPTAFCNANHVSQFYYNMNLYTTNDKPTGTSSNSTTLRYTGSPTSNTVNLSLGTLNGGYPYMVLSGDQNYPNLQVFTSTGVNMTGWVNDPSTGKMYFDYSGTAASKTGAVYFRNQPGGGTTVLSVDKDGLMYHNAFAVASLPACALATRDAETIVTDATAFTPGSAPTGGGTIRVPVYCQLNNTTYSWIMY